MSIEYIIQDGDNSYKISGAENVPRMGEKIDALFGGQAMHDVGHNKLKVYRVTDVRYEVIIEDELNSPSKWINAERHKREQSKSSSIPVVYVETVASE